MRDIYAVDGEHMLIVTTDRLSAFDVVLPDPIPGKGRVLTAISNFWFERTRHIVPNHLTDEPLARARAGCRRARAARGTRDGREATASALPIEAVVRGYLIGSGWKDYQQTGAVCGIALPAGPAAGGPAAGADVHAGDQGRDRRSTTRTSPYERVVALDRPRLAEQVRDTALALYALRRRVRARARHHHRRHQVRVRRRRRRASSMLIDEALTPDSSRFWPADTYRAGTSPPSFDKQFVRDYLETLDWDKRAPGPRLPPEIIARTSEKYAEALRRLTS